MSYGLVEKKYEFEGLRVNGKSAFISKLLGDRIFIDQQLK